MSDANNTFFEVTDEKSNKDDSIGFEEVGAIGGSLIGLDIGGDYGWLFSPANANSIQEIALNAGKFFFVVLGSSLLGGTVGKLTGRGIDKVCRKLK